MGTRSIFRYGVQSWRAARVLNSARAMHHTTSDRISLVQGASRGLGLEFVRQLLERPGYVIATCRQPEFAVGLQELQSFHNDRLLVVQLDTTDARSIERAAHHVSARHSRLDTLINVSGVLHVPNILSPETSIARLTLESLELSFRTNTFGPILVCKAFLPLLITAGDARGALKERPAVIANMSARVGSIGDNGLGGWYSYRASKAALNQLTKTLSIELARKHHAVAAVLLHPGTCNTDLSKPFQRNVKPEKLFSRERGVTQLLHIIDNITMGDTGRFIAWDGTDIQW